MFTLAAPIYLLIGFCVGVVLTVIAAYFVARNNKKQTMELLNIDLKAELDNLADNISVDEKIQEIIDGIKNKL